MIVTEEEAKTKWCPEAWGGRRVVDGDKALCIGSACMAWRWTWDTDMDRSTTHGFCGKAGKP